VTALSSFSCIDPHLREVTMFESPSLITRIGIGKGIGIFATRFGGEGKETAAT
jgi:hypothetical protein